MSPATRSEPPRPRVGPDLPRARAPGASGDAHAGSPTTTGGSKPSGGTYHPERSYTRQAPRSHRSGAPARRMTCSSTRWALPLSDAPDARGWPTVQRRAPASRPPTSQTVRPPSVLTAPDPAAASERAAQTDRAPVDGQLTEARPVVLGHGVLMMRGVSTRCGGSDCSAASKWADCTCAEPARRRGRPRRARTPSGSSRLRAQSNHRHPASARVA